MTEKQRIDLENKFDEISQDSSPFKDVIKPKTNETITWIEPKLVAEISFAEWTKDNQLRQASFKGLRLDKNPKEIVREKPEDNILPEEKLENKTKDEDTKKPSKEEDVVLGIKISNPDKIIFQDPVLNKIDIARYYEQVAERMMPYVGNRILSSIRCPKGIDEQCFFKKHPAKKSQGIATIPIKNSQGQDEEYFYIENNLGIISEVQLGTVEFHVWGSQIDDPEKPDMMVFDLDPDEGMDLAQVRQGVKDLKSLLDSLPLISYLKTSGGKGYHVVVPFRPTVNWETFHDFAKSVAKAMNSRYPDRYTDNIRKAKRKGRIFIDYVRNARSATSIAPYSLRARKGASVSMPISWEELDTIAPNGVDIKEALLRIKAPDPWKDFYKTEQELKV